jgi:hypothetical protein
MDLWMKNTSKWADHYLGSLMNVPDQVTFACSN